MPQTYFAVGSTLANMVNLESTYGLFAHGFESAPIPLTGGVRRRSLAAVSRHDGWINGGLFIDYAARTDLNEFLYARFGYPASADAALYMTLIDEDGHYSPFLLRAEKPTFQVSNKALVRQIVFPLWNCVLQSATKTSNFTVTTSTRLLYADTTSGSVTFALPAVAGVNPYTVFSFVKTASANNMVLDPNSTEQIAGASTLTITAQYERADIYTDGSAWYRI